MDSDKLDEIFNALKSIKAPGGFGEKVLSKAAETKRKFFSFALRISFALAALFLIFFAKDRKYSVAPSDILISNSEVTEMESSLIDDFYDSGK